MELLTWDVVNANINDDRTRFEPFSAYEARLSNCGYDNVRSAEL
jgi:hypothetical protein